MTVKDLMKPQVFTVAPEDMIDRTADTDIKSALFDQVARAKSLGIFGAPSFVVDEELYWGDDRLDMAIRQAAAI